MRQLLQCRVKYESYSTCLVHPWFYLLSLVSPVSQQQKQQRLAVLHRLVHISSFIYVLRVVCPGYKCLQVKL